MLTAMAGTAAALLQRVAFVKAAPLLSQLLNGPKVRLAAAAPPVEGRLGRLGEHMPLLQVSLPRQGLPHAPQLVKDAAVLAQLPLQQPQPAGQAAPTAPQLAVSFCRLTHVLLTHTVLLLHCTPHAPQLKGSLTRATQAAGP